MNRGRSRRGWFWVGRFVFFFFFLKEQSPWKDKQQSKKTCKFINGSPKHGLFRETPQVPVTYFNPSVFLFIDSPGAPGPLAQGFSDMSLRAMRWIFQENIPKGCHGNTFSLIFFGPSLRLHFQHSNERRRYNGIEKESV